MAIIIPSKNIYSRNHNAISNKKIGSISITSVDASAEEKTTDAISFEDIDITGILESAGSESSERHTLKTVYLDDNENEYWVVDAFCAVQKEKRADLSKIENKKRVSLFKDNGILNVEKGEIKVSVTGTIITKQLTGERYGWINPLKKTVDFKNNKIFAEVVEGTTETDVSTWSFDERSISFTASKIKSTNSTATNLAEISVTTDTIFLDDDDIEVSEINGYDAYAYIPRGNVLCGFQLIKLAHIPEKPDLTAFANNTEISRIFSYTGVSIEYIPRTITVSVGNCELYKKTLQDVTTVIGDETKRENAFNIERNELVQRGSSYNYSEKTTQNIKITVQKKVYESSYNWNYTLGGKTYNGEARYYSPSSDLQGKEKYTLELKDFDISAWNMEIPSSCDVEMTEAYTFKKYDVPIGIYGTTLYFDLGYNRPISNTASYYPPTTLTTSIDVSVTESVYSEDAINYLYGETLERYKNGKETAVIKCSISDYYDENGDIKISKSGDKMSFDIYDEVIPYAFNDMGIDAPISTREDGESKIFQVVGIKFIYDGAVWQELTLQEV